MDSSILQSAPIATLTIIVETPQVSYPTPIFGVKRGPKLALVPLGKRGRGDEVSESMALVPYMLDFSPKMALAYLGGVIVVSSAKKRKPGRPKGSLNKKTVGVADQFVQGPKRAKKRSFGAG